MKKMIALVILLLVAVLMAVTRPEEQKHKDVMMAAVKEYIDEEAQERGFGDNAITRLGKNVVNQAVKTALNQKLKFTDYYLVNTTHVKLDGEDQLLSLGILGQVITFDKDMLREKLQEAAKTKEAEAVRKAAAKEEAKALKRQLKEQNRLEKQRLKEQKKLEKQRQKELKKQEKQKAKEEKAKAKAKQQ